jgi:long-chain acyl-CoA synthetase
MRIVDLLRISAANHPETIVVKSASAGILYGRMLADVEDLSEQLRSAGCSRGIKVAVVLDDSAEYLVSFFAISAAEGTILPLSTRMTPFEAVRLIERADVSIVITSERYGKRLSAAIGEGLSAAVIHVRYDTAGKLVVDAAKAEHLRTDEGNSDVALMVPTSGTTGVPKIVMLTDDNLLSNMAVYRLLMGFKGHQVVYCGLSLHHIYCICAQILTHISRGDTFVLTGRPFFIRDFLKIVQREAVTAAAFVPSMAILLAEYPEPQEFDLASLKYITLSGAKTPRFTYETLTRRYPATRFINTYGMSEAGSRISIAAPFPQHYPVDSVGRPMPGVSVRIADESEYDLPANCPGEILVNSSGVMKGYYKQPDLTAQTVVDGWLKTGDIGKLDEHRNLFILGRIKDTIVTGGENVCPFEIEECLIEHPAIREVAVVAKTDRLLQEVPCAFIVKKDGEQYPTDADIKKFCKVRLSSHKVPRFVRFLEQLPKLEASKIDRNSLRKVADTLH